jgi:4-amino-4-deoxy-L-arabinose transferase-like glycosyltransferase
MQAVMGAITVFFINGIASRFFGYFAGLIAAFLYAIYIPFIYYTGLILSETTFFFFTFAALFMLSRFYCSNKKSELVFAGVLFGLSALTRPVSLPLPILAFFLFLFRKDDSENIPRFFRAIKTTLALLLVVFLTIVPWSIRNWIVEGEPVFIDVNAGVNFYIGHNPRSTGWYVYMDAEDPIIKQQMTPEGDRAGRKAAFDYISNHIEETKSLFFKVHNAFWNVNDFDIEEKGKVLKDIVNKFQLPALEFLDLKFLSWIGVLALIIYPRTSIYIALFILSYNIVIDFIYFAPRYRMVIEPFLILLIAGGTNVITNLLKVSFRLGR